MSEFREKLEARCDSLWSDADMRKVIFGARLALDLAAEEGTLQIYEEVRKAGRQISDVERCGVSIGFLRARAEELKP